MDQSLIIIFTTIDTLDNAKGIARQAVEEKRALCVNIIPNGLSFYQWEGIIHESNEYFILFKTCKEKQGDLEEWLVKTHPYTTPIVIQSEVLVNKSYLQSMLNEMKNIS